MPQWNVAEAKALFFEVAPTAVSDEGVVTVRDNSPLPRLVPRRSVGGRRQPGQGRGGGQQHHIHPGGGPHTLLHPPQRG